MTPPVVLVLRGSDRFSEMLWESGCQVINLAVTKTEPLDDLTDLNKSIAQIGVYDGVFLTSPVAAEVFVRELKARGGKFAGKIYVLGERAKLVFENAGMSVEYRNDANTAGELVAAFGEAEFAGKRLLYIRGDRSMQTIPDVLGSNAQIDEVVVYSTTDDPPDAETAAEIRMRLRNGEITWVCFFAPSSVDSFRKIFELEDLNGIKTAAIGNTTGRRIRETGMHLDLVSERANAEDFANGLVRFIKSIE